MEQTGLEGAPYSPNIVQNLLSVRQNHIDPHLSKGVTEWKGVKDIVRLSFQALQDVVRAQGETLRELERQMPTRVSSILNVHD